MLFLYDKIAWWIVIEGNIHLLENVFIKNTYNGQKSKPQPLLILVFFKSLKFEKHGFLLFFF